MPEILEQRLVDEETAARYLSMSQIWLRKSRCEGARSGHATAPPWIKIGRSVRYDIRDLEDWIDRHRKDSSTDALQRGGI